MNAELEHLRGWIGNAEERVDRVTARLVDAYHATVTNAESAVSAGGTAPAGIHWCLTTPSAPMSGLGADGHPHKGGFLPPVPAPRRMWAGSSVAFLDPLCVGDEVVRRSVVASVDCKAGRSGDLWFVAVDHIYSTVRGVAVRERQDIVYRGEAAFAPAAPEAEPGSMSEHDAALTVHASTALLFRFSALTFNSHRIHYDRDYATKVEHYQNLVVHGPLQAALLLELAQEMRGGVVPATFAFRGVKTLLAGGDIECRGVSTGADSAELWTGRSRQAPHMQAKAGWTQPL